MDSTPQKPTRHDIDSPFVDCVTECRSSMRKLRKKIYKYIKYNPDYQKMPAASINLGNSLKNMNLPPQLLNKLKSHRLADFSALDYS